MQFQKRSRQVQPVRHARPRARRSQLLFAFAPLAPLAMMEGACSSAPPSAEAEAAASTTEAYESGVSGPCAADVLAADTNGDGRSDYVELGANGVRVSLANGSGFDAPTSWSSSFGASQAAGLWPSTYASSTGERVSALRKLADVNGDGRADMVGFAHDGVYVALSTGTTFGPARLWVADYGADQGWTEGSQERVLADVDGDGMADVVGFGNLGVSVSRSTGTAFGAPQMWRSGYFSNSSGWTADRYLRFVADVNGDGRGDLVGFGSSGVWVSLSTGTSFGLAYLWVAGFGANQGYTLASHVRTLADVNGDGKMDVVGFWNDGVYVSTSTGAAFSAPVLWTTAFANDRGWNVLHNLREVADVDGDHRADIVGFGDDAVFVSTSTGASFLDSTVWSHEYGGINGWQTTGLHAVSRPRLVTDFTGDGKADIIGLGPSSLRISTSSGTSFGTTDDALTGAMFHSCKPAVCLLDAADWQANAFEQTLHKDGCTTTGTYRITQSSNDGYERVGLCPARAAIEAFVAKQPATFGASFSATAHDECLPAAPKGWMWVFWANRGAQPGPCDNCEKRELPSDEVLEVP